jgi:hypothetical protein
MSRTTALLIFATAWPAAVLADDLYPPWFRGLPGTAYQEWSFNVAPQGYYEWYPDLFDNPYGTPLAFSLGEALWHDEFMGRQGVMQTEYDVIIYIPSGPGVRHDYMQFTWHGNNPPYLYWYDALGPTSSELLLTQDLGSGWTYQLWGTWNAFGGTGCLRLGTTGTTYFDQMIGDLMPEPTAGVLLSLALLLRRRCAGSVRAVSAHK